MNKVCCAFGRFPIGWTILTIVLLAGLDDALGADYHMGRSSHNPFDDRPLVPGRVYDGSTAERVDEFMRNVPENSAIQFESHVFETRGVWDNWLGATTIGFRVKKGWTIAGKGTNSVTGTVFKLIDVPVDKSGLYEHNAVFSTGGVGLYLEKNPAYRRVNLDRITIRDLQIDCNYQEIAKKKGKAIQLNGIQLLGNHGMRIENILVRHAASKKVDRIGQEVEGFQVYIHNHWAPDPPGDFFIDRVAITDYEGGYTSAICINGNATGVVQNCSIDLKSDRSQHYGINFAAGINNFTIRSNTVWNATRGVNNDTGPLCTNVLLVSNFFYGCRTGMLLANSKSNFILGNTFELTGGGSGIAIRHHPVYVDIKSSGCVVQGNVLSGPGGEGISLGYQNEFDSRDLTFYWSSNNIVQSNIVSSELENKIPPYSIAPNIARPGNRQHAANYPACNNGGQMGNIAPIGFPSDIGLGADCSYCEARAVDSSFGYISRVRLHGSKLDMRSDWGDGTGYSDFTTGYHVGVGTSRRQRNYSVQWAAVRRGRVYQLDIHASALAAPRPADFHVYIDLDHDGEFQRQRDLVATGWSKEFVRADIAIPRTAAVGSTRMRVVMGGGAAPSPCATNTFWGEVEDYTLSILP